MVYISVFLISYWKCRMWFWHCWLEKNINSWFNDACEMVIYQVTIYIYIYIYIYVYKGISYWLVPYSKSFPTCKSNVLQWIIGNYLISFMCFLSQILLLYSTQNKMLRELGDCYVKNPWMNWFTSVNVSPRVIHTGLIPYIKSKPLRLPHGNHRMGATWWPHDMTNPSSLLSLCPVMHRSSIPTPIPTRTVMRRHDALVM